MLRQGARQQGTGDCSEEASWRDEKGGMKKTAMRELGGD
jgi:hypothetical protein